MLQRTFAGKYTEYLDGVLKHDIESDIRHTTHYIGIPVNAYYTFLRGQRIKLYAYAGGTAEKAVSNKFKVLDGPERIFLRLRPTCKHQDTTAIYDGFRNWLES